MKDEIEIYILRQEMNRSNTITGILYALILKFELFVYANKNGIASVCSIKWKWLRKMDMEA